MSVLIIVEPQEGKLNKGVFELATFGKKTADALGQPLEALIINQASNAGDLGLYGVSAAHQIDIAAFDSSVYTDAIYQVAQKVGANTVLLRHNSNGKNLAGRIAIKMNAGLVSGVNRPAEIEGGVFTVTKGVYSGKAIAKYEINSANKVLTIMGNAIQPEVVGSAISVSPIAIDLKPSKTRVIERKTVTGIVPLPEAELVVSAGRGMKGPENWGIIEDLAGVLGATTACSRPVADSDWRPHHEHVGQTGVAIRPNLYIAVGISGAIQHLAGVNNSKTIVVINKDPEAPFFKAADYGVVGDLFDVVPKLTEAIKKLKAH
jgi:electron transfer flavoprotein alpha subunit